MPTSSADLRCPLSHLLKNLQLTSIQALKQLIQQILTENESSLKSWQHRLEEGLEGNGKLMIDLIPDLELVIGIYTIDYLIQFFSPSFDANGAI